MAAIFLDIDHFKRVNDAYGHGCGDQVLKSIATSIKKIVRRGDLVIRYGGEEILVITLSDNIHDTIAMAERLRSSAKTMMHICSGREFYVTLSAGLAFREQGESLELLIDRADEKMYDAKQNGRDCLIF